MNRKRRKIVNAIALMIACCGLILCINTQKTEAAPTEGRRPLTFTSDDMFLDFIQKTHINYMWDGAEKTSGLAPERIHMDGVYPENDANVITTGGSGFGIAGLIVGIDRGFIPRTEGVARLHRITDYLAKADRFHGVWPHWIHGPTGKVKPFSQKDNGGDLVESAFLIQGLLCAREYFKDGNENEKQLAAKIDRLWREMEWDWYLNGKDVLYWHWSPKYGWEMNFPLEGYNECLITYILGASSPTHPIPASAYHNGWARGGAIKSTAVAYGLPLILKHNGAEEYGGPLFWAHYSYIGLSPKGLKDQYADYWEVNKNQTLINYNYCKQNPKGFKGYGKDCWGLTASYSVNGYSAHMPVENDLGVITPTAALSSFPYTPGESMKALRHFYFDLGGKIWGKYGFYDAFSIQDNWYPQRYLAIDQLTIAPMIENYRSGLLWKLFMGAPEIQEGLKKLGFTYTPQLSGQAGLSSWKSFSGDKRIEQRVDSVLKLMTLEEKIGQMTQFSANWSITGPVMPGDFQPYLEKGLVGSIFNATSVEGVRKMQEVAVEKTRLGIPILFGQDVIHGYKTIFPIPLGEACSWDLEMMRRAAEIAAIEAASDGINWTFAPMVDITRDARWGRVMEGAGEDPYLGSKAAAARVMGFQGGSDWRSLSSDQTLLACGKHLAAYGAAESGRDYNTAELSEHTLRNVYLPPYEAAAKAGVGTFMASFNEINGIPATADHWLLTDVLRNEWGFNGFVVSDYTGINELVPHGVAKDEKQAAELAVNAGVDMDMTGATYIKYLAESVREGNVSEKTINNAARRILEMKFLLGLFDDPYRYLDENRAKKNTMRPEFMETARKAVASSVVLLKNDQNILPISKESGKTIALIGPLMNDSINLNGEWAGLGDRNKSVPILKGLTEKYKGSSVRLIYTEGSTITETTPAKIAEAVRAARRADVVIAAMGEDFNWSGEAAARTDIRLPQAQLDLLKALKQTGKPIVLVTLSGRPLDLSWEDKNMTAILQAWFPGTQAGHGIADVIAGDYNPSGRLAMSFPRNVGQIPIYYNQKNTGRPVDLSNETIDYKSNYLDTSITPLYPFGYGLSYTTFAISNVASDKSSIKTTNDKIVITANVRNTGDVDGELVVQLYVRDLVGSVTRPVKELKGFQKIALKAGESKQVTFELSSEDLAFYGIDGKKKTEPGDFKLWIAQSSADNSNEINFSAL